jgi:tRNA pseudouridine55 synthase
MDGILLLDKPAGMTSNEALQTVKKIYHAKKAGHTGSLDPLASGMLPICLGQATKFSQFLLTADKCYRVIGKLGIKTTTGDAEGEVIETHAVKDITVKHIDKILTKFRGEIEQIPSMYSALKHHGKPLYKLARQGKTVERKPRTVTIHKLELLGYEKELMELEICCSKGTYVRTLIEDIGDALKCAAHVVALRRLSCGPYKESQMVTLQSLKDFFAKGGQTAIDSLLLPIDSMLADLPEVKLSEAAAYYLRHGQAIISPYAPTAGMVRLTMKDDRFLGVGEILSDGKVAPVRLINF